MALLSMATFSRSAAICWGGVPSGSKILFHSFCAHRKVLSFSPDEAARHTAISKRHEVRQIEGRIVGVHRGGRQLDRLPNAGGCHKGCWGRRCWPARNGKNEDIQSQASERQVGGHACWIPRLLSPSRPALVNKSPLPTRALRNHLRDNIARVISAPSAPAKWYRRSVQSRHGRANARRVFRARSISTPRSPSCRWPAGVRLYVNPDTRSQRRDNHASNA